MKNDNLSDFLTDIANAIREKTGTTNLINALNFSLEIRNISSEPSVQTAPFKDVNFYDYNGTILYSYYWDEFLEYKQLPPLPTIHEQKGLICYMWNYTLAEIIEQGGRCDVGAMYKTADGYTHIFLTPDYVSGKTVTLNGFDADIVYWGDGNVEEYKEGITHVYDLIGKAEIIVEGSLGYTGISDSQALKYIISQDVDEVWFGNWSTAQGTGVRHFGANFFKYCYAKYITLPEIAGGFYYGANILMAPNLRHINILSEQARYLMRIWCPKLETISFNYRNRGTSVISLGLHWSSFINSNSLLRFHFPTLVELVVLEDLTNVPESCPIRLLLEISVSVANAGLEVKHNVLVPKNTLATDNALLMCKNSYIVLVGTILASVDYIMPLACSGMFNKVLDMQRTSLRPYAFLGSDYITLDYRECTSVRSLSSTTCLEGCTNLKIVVPDSLYDQWIAAAYWVNFADSIIKASEYTEN